MYAADSPIDFRPFQCRVDAPDHPERYQKADSFLVSSSSHLSIHYIQEEVQCNIKTTADGVVDENILLAMQGDLMRTITNEAILAYEKGNR